MGYQAPPCSRLTAVLDFRKVAPDERQSRSACLAPPDIHIHGQGDRVEKLRNGERAHPAHVAVAQSLTRNSGSLDAGTAVLTECHVRPGDRQRDFRLARLRSRAARTSAAKAASSSVSSARRSIARRVLPSRLELNRPAGSSRWAPLAKVTLT